MHHFFQGASPLRAYGSLSLSLGYFAMSVRVSPNMMLILDEAFIAQPFALRSGAMLRLRSLSHAMTIAGPEMTSMTPTKARITCHHLRAKIPFARLARAVPIMPTAIPKAAKIPANFPISNGAASAGFTGAAPGAGAAAGAAFIFSVASFIILASLSAAFLLMRFSTAVAILRYGDQNACAMLIGLSTIFVITASHSSPLLS